MRRAGERVGTYTRVSSGIPGLRRVQSSTPISTGEYSVEKFISRNYVCKFLIILRKKHYLTTCIIKFFFFVNLAESNERNLSADGYDTTVSGALWSI